MTKKICIKWGIIGCGKHATKVMIPAFSSSSLSILYALASASKHASLAQQYPDCIVYDSYRSLLDDPEIEAVYIGLPNHLHAQWTIRALHAGKHVLCDKPLALSIAEVVEISRAAAASGLRYAEGFMYRFHPQYQVVRKLLSEKLLGEVRLLEGHFHYSLQDYSNIRWQADAGGGALRDVGCYIIDVAHFLFPATKQQNVSETDVYQSFESAGALTAVRSGSITDGHSEISRVTNDKGLVDQTHVISVPTPTTVVTAATAVIHAQQQVDEFITAQLLLPGGPVVHLTAGCNLPRRNTLSLFGTKGILELDRAFIIPRNAKARLKLWNLDSEKPEILEIPAANQYSIELDSFSRACAAEDVDESLFSDGKSNAEVIETIRAKIDM